MRIGRILVFATLFYIPLWLAAQPVIREYKGRYINGMTYPAEAEYDYYLNDRGEEVRHGNFKYQVRETDGNDKYSQAIRGKYTNGLKDGSWTYRISIHDFNDGKGTAFVSGSIGLIAKYENGFPEGRWEYTSSLKEREEVVEDGNKKWGRFSPTRKISIMVNFKNGMMVDSVRVSDSHGTSIYGVFDANGFFHHDWIFLTDSTEEIYAYDHGVLIRHTFRKLAAEKFEIEEDYASNVKKLQQLRAALPKGPSALANLPFSMDTSSIFGRASHPVRTLMLERIYNDKDFLYRYIPGDLNYVFDEDRRYFKLDMKGGSTVSFTVKLTPGEESRLMRIRTLRSDIADIKTRTDLIARGKTLPPNLKNAVDLINYNANLAEGYACLALKIAQAESVKEGKAESNTCKMFTTVEGDVSDSATKAAAFDAILVEMQKLKEGSQKYYNQIRQY